MHTKVYYFVTFLSATMLNVFTPITSNIAVHQFAACRNCRRRKSRHSIVDTKGDGDCAQTLTKKSRGAPIYFFANYAHARKGQDPAEGIGVFSKHCRSIFEFLICHAFSDEKT